MVGDFHAMREDMFAQTVRSKMADLGVSPAHVGLFPSPSAVRPRKIHMNAVFLASEQDLKDQLDGLIGEGQLVNTFQGSQYKARLASEALPARVETRVFFPTLNYLADVKEKPNFPHGPEQLVIAVNETLEAAPWDVHTDKLNFEVGPVDAAALGVCSGS